MVSSTMMIVLLAFYIIIAAVSALESNWPRVLYWLGASIITTSILWGMKP